MSGRRAFQDFNEGPIDFPPTYKYNIGSNVYDTSEKARTPSYTDRILWRSTSPYAQAELLYYGRADVQTSDHRPVSAIFDVDVEICDEIKLNREYVGIYEKFRPSNALVVFDMRADLIQRKAQLFDEFESYVKRKYGSEIAVFDRFAQISQNFMSLFMFFDQGEQAKKVMIPAEDELPSGICFRKRLIDKNDDLALALKMHLLFSNGDETMFSESINYDLGVYQQPARESLSTEQDVTKDETTFKGSNENFHQPKIDELMSFDTEQKLLTNSLFDDHNFDPLHFSSDNKTSSSFISTSTTGNAMFYIDQSMNNNSSASPTLFSYQLPSRPAPPVPVGSLPRPVSLKNLSLNPFQSTQNEIVDDLVDLGDPGSPPPSPKFDPYG